MRAFRLEATLTKTTIVASTVSFVAFVIEITGQFRTSPKISPWLVAEDAVFCMIVLLLLCGNLVYQLARLGYVHRRAHDNPVPRTQLELIYDRPAPHLTILIPSYREEVHVLRQTLLSAALVEYPERRVVVLIDDPPTAAGEQRATLEATRRMIAAVNECFAERASVLRGEYQDFLARSWAGRSEAPAESLRLARLYDELAEWVEDWAGTLARSTSPGFAHTDQFFAEQILLAPAAAHRMHAASLRVALPDASRIAREYRRLAELLSVAITSFERKRYASLSHEPNKAMNLNSYIGLIGGSYREATSRDGIELVECAPDEATLTVPPADFLLTLDADSFVLGDYALRLVHILERDPRIAVAQTPYSAVPGAPRPIERVAGATTDIQYIVHQGFTHFDATYWVGANAMLRFSALADIAKVVEDRGRRIKVFIQDRTVIEDTGSTVDLIRRGWTLYNHPERLAYSATPPDFGALVIQRRRWSNGGLIILSDLVRYLRDARRWRSARGLLESLMRCYYLCSPAVASFGLLAIILYPWNSDLLSVWLPLTAAPYYLLYGRDLRSAGYRWLDLPRVYALNLILLPVNIAGVLRSLQQAATGRKSAFGRTPKVEDRTASPPVHVLFQWAMLAYLGIGVVVDVGAERYPRALFSLANGALYIYAITHFLGWRQCWSDVMLGVTNRWPGLGDLARGVKTAGPDVPVALAVFPVADPIATSSSGRLRKMVASSQR